MKNRVVGVIVIGLAILLGFIVFSFNRSLNNIATASCSDIVAGLQCPIVESFNFQTKLSLIVVAFVAGLGLYLVFFAHEERIVTKIVKVKEQIQPNKITKDNYQKIIENLNQDEKIILENIIDSQGSVMQSELVNKTGLTKVKTTRILDRLEGKGLIERKRRGMTNVVILKH